MANLAQCAYCHEESDGEPVRIGDRLYCCEACAFEASQKTKSICGGRSSVELAQRYKHKLPSP